MYNFNHDGEKFKLRISNVRYSVDEVGRTVAVKATVGVRAPKFVLNTVQLHQMPEGTTPESVYPFGLDGHEGVEMEAVARCSKSDEFNTEVGKRVAMAKLEAAAHRRFSKTFLKWAKKFLEYAGNLYSSVEEFAEKCSEVESRDDLYIRCMTGKYPDGRYRWPHEFEGFTGGGDPGRKDLVRVVELITEKRLVELYNSGSKPEAFRTEDLGDGIFKATYRGGYEVADEPGAMERLMPEREAVEFMKTADGSGIEVLSALRSMWRFEDDGRPLYRVRYRVREDNPGVKDKDDRKPVSPEQVAESLEKTREAARTLSVEKSDRKPDSKGQDHESERITKAMARMIWRKVKDLDIRGALDAMEATDRGTLKELVDEAMESGCPYVTSPGELHGDWRPGVKFPAGAVENGLVDPGLEYYEATGRKPETPTEKYNVGQHLKRLKPEERERYEKLFAADERTEESNKNVSDPGDYSYGGILRSMDETHTRKNSDYGDAAYKGYKKYGDYYFLTQLHNKFTRLENLTVNNEKPQVEDESIDDTLLDMANYAVMYLESRHRND